MALAFSATAYGQTGEKSDSTKTKRVKRSRITLPADTLPGVELMESSYRKIHDDTLKGSKRSTRTFMEKETQSQTGQNPDSAAVNARTNYRNRRMETVTIDSANAPGDTLIKRKQGRKNRETAQGETPWYYEPYVPVVLTPDQIASLLLDSGTAQLSRQQYSRALRSFDSLISTYENTFQFRQALYFRGKTYMAMQNDLRAITDFQKFLKIDRNQSNFTTDVYYNLAILRFRNGQMNEAMSDIQWVMNDTAYKNHRYAYFYRAFCRAALHQDNIGAIQDLTRFLEADGGKTFSSAEALYYRGFYKAELKDNRGAIKDYDEAIRLYEAGLNPKAASPHHQKLIDTYIVRGLAKSDIKKYDDAIADFNIVLRLNPKYALAYRLKGLAEIGKGDKDNGCLHLSRAGELGANEAYDDIKQHCR